MSTVLRVRDLAVEFNVAEGKVRAVDGVSFSIPEGKTVALVGESGSGKTVVSQTIMRILPRPAQVVGGEVLFFDPDRPGNFVDICRLGENSKEMRAIRGGRISIIFQEPMTSLSPLHTIGNQISESLELHRNQSGKEALEMAADMLRMVGFPAPDEAVHKYPFELSGGLRQRAMIAMALICEPSLLIADEPTTALDVTIQAQILALLKELQAEFGMAILLITHDLGVVAEIADEVVVMYHGQVMEAAPVDAVFRQPRHQYLKGLLGAIPTFDTPAGERLKPLREIPLKNAEGLRGLVARRQADAATTGTGPLLSVRNLSKTFQAKSQQWRFNKGPTPEPAVDDVSFDIYPGECLGLVGESGSGKTTVGKLILRALQPDGGSVTLDNGTGPVDVLLAQGPALDALRTRMQMIFQDPISSLSPRMTVGSILHEPLDIHDRGDMDERRELVSALLNAIGLGDKAASRYPHSFSGGQRQRIGIARALTLAPELIVCDEVSSALDVSVQAQVLNLLKDLQRELQLSYLFISHDLAVVSYMADRIAVMWRGRLVEIGPCKTLLADPVHPYTQALLAAVPHPDPDHVLDVAATGKSALESSQDWPEMFMDRPGEALALVDIGDGHMVRMRADARQESVA